MRKDVSARPGRHACAHVGLIMVAFLMMLAPLAARAAPFAAIVMDARTGEVLYSNNAETRLNPASLTKMMTLYIAFQAIERGEIRLDTKVRISSRAANEPPSKLGLKAGQQIEFRYLIRAAAIRSANDSATAIAEAISGSQEAFSRRMDKTAQQLGMKGSTFRNAHGLTAKGHLSTARDMTILGRHLFYDFPQYYNLFSRRTTDAGLAEVANTNRRFLDAYKGADGIKTGFTNAAGFNLTASAERNGVRLIATVFGGTSTAQRNAKMAELLDLGFKKAPRNAPVRAPKTPAYVAPAANSNVPLADAAPAAEAGVALAQSGEGEGPAKTLRLSGAVKKSPRPLARPLADVPDALVASIQEGVASALAETASAAATEVAAVAVPPVTEAVAAPFEVAAAEPAAAPETPAPASLAEAGGARPVLPEAEAVDVAEAVAEPTDTIVFAEMPVPETVEDPVQIAAAATPQPRPAVFIGKDADPITVPTDPEVVTRISTSGGRHWGINVGRFTNRGSAERALLKIQLAETATLNDGLRKVVERSGGYDANFMGLGQDQADLACRRLQARAVHCFTIGP